MSERRRHLLQGLFQVGGTAAASVSLVPVGLAGQLRVTVDGDGLRGVVAADTWRGWADVLALDQRGEQVTWEGRAQLRRYHGRVEAWIVDATCDDVDVLTRAGLVLG